MGIGFVISGGFDKTKKFFERMLNQEEFKDLDSYGRAGVSALAAATPKRTGRTANSWDYRVSRSDESGKVSIEWSNSNTNKGVNIAILNQYGHGTRNGGYVPPRDYINPAMAPVMKQAGDGVWTEVTSR